MSLKGDFARSNGLGDSQGIPTLTSMCMTFPCNYGALGRTRTSDARFRNQFCSVLPVTSDDVCPVQGVFSICPVMPHLGVPQHLIPKGFPKDALGWIRMTVRSGQ